MDPYDGQEVHGVVWEVTEPDLLTLDRLEGAPQWYKRATVHVVLREASDGCGGTCGCEGEDVCFDGACCAATCDGAPCGAETDDGCGGTCGDCLGGQICAKGQCVVDCTPQCDGLSCGDNGCGGICGFCARGLPA